MKSPLLAQIVNAVLYEGYILYPYRASSVKNQRERFTFGRVYPKDYSVSQKGAEACVCQTECLLRLGDQPASVEVTVGFLQPMWREVGLLSSRPADESAAHEISFHPREQLLVDGVAHQSWQEAREREVTVRLEHLQSGKNKSFSFPFSFSSSSEFELLAVESGANRVAIRRRQESIAGEVEVNAVSLSAGAFKLTVRVRNRTPMSPEECENSDAMIMRTFASTHTVLHATEGEFISLLEPAEEFVALVAECKNIGTWPVLVGDQSRGDCDTLLSSPIILYDYPQISPESKGSFFDGTEIDEILTLRVMTLTDGEKLEMRQVDEYARGILERSESANAGDFFKMHGVMRGLKAMEDFFNPPQAVKSISVQGRELKAGSRVRIHPKKRADAFDMIIAGKIGIIEAIEQDAEDSIHLALVLEDDPGKDLGMARQSGHRFFYGLDEVEPLTEATV
jgi:hydrogenase maturation protease